MVAAAERSQNCDVIVVRRNIRMPSIYASSNDLLVNAHGRNISRLTC